jgi:opacity protein-like surface antigen
MGSLKTLALAGAVLAGATSVAAAADLRGPLPAGLPPAPIAVPIAESSGWYLRGDVGIGVLNSGKLNYSDNDPGVVIRDKIFGGQFSGGVGVGYQLNSWFRADLTAEYRFGAKLGFRDSYSFSGVGNCVSLANAGLNCTSFGSNVARGTISSTVFLANAYLDLGTWHGLTPYIGGGVGFAQNRVSGLKDSGVNAGFVTATGAADSYGTSTGAAANGTKSNFAYALMAGVSADVGSNLKLDAGYRYLNMGKFQSGTYTCPGGCGGTYSLQGRSLDAHEVRIGLRWMLGGPAVASAPLPYPAHVTKKF